MVPNGSGSGVLFLTLASPLCTSVAVLGGEDRRRLQHCNSRRRDVLKLAAKGQDTENKRQRVMRLWCVITVVLMNLGQRSCVLGCDENR